MKIIKPLSLVIIIYLIIDVIHFVTFRFNPSYSEITEAFYESNQMTYIKWGLCLLGLLGLFMSNMNSNLKYLFGLSGIGMIIFFLIDGPLNHMFLWYSTISFWVLLIIGIAILYKLVNSFKHKNKL